MNARMARFLTSMYPRRWRERYEQEFEHFLQEHSLTARVLFNVIGSALYQRLRSFSHGRGLFARWTQGARRAVFFARHEAIQFGNSSIEPEHLLLGILHENRNDLRVLFASSTAINAICDDARTHLVGSKHGLLINLPLSPECKRILAYTQEEAARLAQRPGVEHLLAGILREDKSKASEILRKHGLQLSAMRDKLAQSSRLRRERPRWRH